MFDFWWCKALLGMDNCIIISTYMACLTWVAPPSGGDHGVVGGGGMAETGVGSGPVGGVRMNVFVISSTNWPICIMICRNAVPFVADPNRL